MPPPSALVIATGAVNRLLKEEASYHKELEEQEAKAKAQEEKIKSGQDDEDGNATYILKQQNLVVEQTKAVFGPLRDRIAKAVEKLEDLITVEEKTGAATAEELANAKAALEKAKAESS
ncbi:tubulin binding cofactor a [Trichoderma arundinaceum]|uniref:Tubulin-specific chaperone A n=1 Tax=Trichoderma arundinaceum TaxID=490622 RepID=A0A395NPK4_TRIAR|nr:tubulin binding cofactor a [Trichoderma arundinaceum]